MFTFETQIILLVIIVLFAIQYAICKYQLNSVVECEIHKNNKKLIKKMTDQIAASFEQYMHEPHMPKKEIKQISNDSVEDPMEGDDTDD